MTECERIMQEGFLPIEFFNPEFICGFYVDELRKKIWAIELELYIVLRDVCDRHGLRLFTDGGTTLGAVRHNGFIPWDDDLDVCLLRNDYEKLKLLSKEFPSPFFLQNADTDSEYGFSFMKLCNSNTAYDVRPFTHALFNKGIHIDIFPIDKVTQEDYLIRRQQISALIQKNSAYMRKDLPRKLECDKKLIDDHIDESMTPADIWHQIERIATEDEEKDTPYLSLLVSTQYAAPKKIWSKNIFDSCVKLDFSSIKVNVPVGYDEQLKIYFGEYMKYPPIEERGKWHSATFFPDIPYKQYYHEHYGLY